MGYSASTYLNIAEYCTKRAGLGLEISNQSINMQEIAKASEVEQV